MANIYTNQNLTTMTETQEQVAVLEEYLSQHYEFRKNILSDKFEVRKIEEGAKFVPITREVINSISLGIKRDGIEVKGLKTLLEEIIYSDGTCAYDPINNYLESLPEWDGQNHIGSLLSRIPGITTEQQYFLSIWLRSCVAHWMDMDQLHGNECIATLIGDQGCGKSTWCIRLLPPELRMYYLDHFNMSNKFDKDMALTNNLLVNLDEMDKIKGAQWAEVKHTVSKQKVNRRPIFGKAQEDGRRYASFVATTNNHHPLSDPTGSRRFVCICIPEGMLIDNESPIDYGQLYAQIVNELRVKKMRFWFTKEEEKRIQELNAAFQQISDLGCMIDVCFRHPKVDEQVKPLGSKEIISHISTQFPGLKPSPSLSVKLGILLKERDYERRNYGDGRKYFIVPLKAA